MIRQVQEYQGAKSIRFRVDIAVQFCHFKVVVKIRVPTLQLLNQANKRGLRPADIRLVAAANESVMVSPQSCIRYDNLLQNPCAQRDEIYNVTSHIR